jgi:peptide/nickel transport system permease protein
VSWLGRLSVPQRVSLALLAAVLLLVALGPVIWNGRAEHVDLAALNEGASWTHPFGTDALGRDMLARTLVATRLSIVLAVLTALLGFALGTALGLLPLAVGPRVRDVVNYFINLLLAFPALLLALVVATIVGIGTNGVVVALAVAMMPAVARLVQALAADVGSADYVDAARVVGVRWPRLMARHVLPNIAAPILLQLGMTIGGALLALSALSFLGLGVQSPDYDWGALLNAGLSRIYVTPIAALGPAVAIVLASVAFNLAGDALAEASAGVGAQRRPRRTRRPGGVVHAVDAGRHGDDDAVLRVEDLTVTFPAEGGPIVPVRGVSLAVRPGERVGIVGESGSGKTLTALALAHLVDPPGEVRARVRELAGTDLDRCAPAERDAVLATTLSIVPQDPLSAFNPVLRVGRQVAEGAEVHLAMPRDEALQRAVERLEELRIAAAARCAGQYPHELSGGMRQRAMIAMGMMTRPRLIVADEPTTALDVTVQRRVLQVLHEVSEREGAAVVLISHDISVVAGFCQRVVVMYAGRIVEEIEAARLDEAAHPYTRALMAAVPDMQTDRAQSLATIPGRPPAVTEVPDGCPFAARCAFADELCRSRLPPLAPVAGSSRAACWHPHGSQALTGVSGGTA